jgi:hypothetical protein
MTSSVKESMNKADEFFEALSLRFRGYHVKCAPTLAESDVVIFTVDMASYQAAKHEFLDDVLAKCSRCNRWVRTTKSYVDERLSTHAV